MTLIFSSLHHFASSVLQFIPKTLTCREWRWSAKPTSETNSDASILRLFKHVCYKINYNESYIAKYLEKCDVSYLLGNTTADS